MGSADLRAEQKVGGRFETENGKPGSFRVRLVIFVAALGLHGCGATRRETFDLSGASIAANTRTFTISRASAVAVAEPSASQLVNSNRLVIRERPTIWLTLRMRNGRIGCRIWCRRA